MRSLTALFLLLLLAFAMSGCAVLSQTTGAETRTIPEVELQALAKKYGFTPCVAPARAVAVLMEVSAGGGAMVTRRCQ